MYRRCDGHNAYRDAASLVEYLYCGNSMFRRLSTSLLSLDCLLIDLRSAHHLIGLYKASESAMLRLAPTSIPLTRGEIAQYELRSEERRRNQPLSSSRRQASTSYANSSIRSAQPHVRAGPWRSVIYHDGTKPRSLSAEGDGPGTDYSDSVCSNPSYGHDTTVSANGHVSGSDGSAKSVMSRRDSVLSSDHDPQHQQLSLPASKEIVNNTDLSPNLDGSRDELDFDTTEALLGLRLANDRFVWV